MISRREAIDAVECITSSMSVCLNEDECHGMKRMQRQVILELTNMPSAQPGWIPLAVKYPETNEDVLLQFPSNQGVGFYENGSWGINTGDGIYSAIGDGEEMPMAWMPLPEPWEGR